MNTMIRDTSAQDRPLDTGRRITRLRKPLLIGGGIALALVGLLALLTGSLSASSSVSRERLAPASPSVSASRWIFPPTRRRR